MAMALAPILIACCYYKLLSKKLLKDSTVRYAKYRKRHNYFGDTV